MQVLISRAAARDLRAIARYTVRTFGVRQAIAYGDSFQNCFVSIAENPRMGRPYDRVRPGVRRFDHKSHAIYYILQDQVVWIIRVLHARQNAAQIL